MKGQGHYVFGKTKSNAYCLADWLDILSYLYLYITIIKLNTSSTFSPISDNFGSGIFFGSIFFAYTSASFQLLIDGAFQEVPFKKIEIHHPCQVPELPIGSDSI